MFSYDLVEMPVAAILILLLSFDVTELASVALLECCCSQAEQVAEMHLVDSRSAHVKDEGSGLRYAIEAAPTFGLCYRCLVP